MNISNHGRLAALAAVGLALGLAGCSGSTNKCKSNTDCKNGQMCGKAGTCIADPCAGKKCPGHMFCDSTSGQCAGTCCQPGDCTDPTTECNQADCAAGKAECSKKTCATPCKTGFTCNAAKTPPTCEATCLTQGCAKPYEMCNPNTGACDIRPPVAGEVGHTCQKTSDCNTGLQCNTNLPGGYCTKQCQSDNDCPQGSFCSGGNSGGICIDACDANAGDCVRGQQCMTNFGSGRPAGCIPQFQVSDCTGSACLPNGSPCTSTQQCLKDASCIPYAGGGICQAIQCQLFGQACDAGETCENLGSGLYACFNDCSAKDPSACSSLTDQYGHLSCTPGPQVAGPSDSYWLTNSTADCHQGETGKQFTVQGQTAAICYKGCTSDSQCNPGQFCGDTSVTLTNGTTVATFKVCMNYNLIIGKTCADGVCGSMACTDINASGQTAAICYNKCTSDGQCTAAFGGKCQREPFVSGSSIQTCTYSTQGSFCFDGCQTDADCGYCSSDADCGKTTGSDGTKVQEKCDIPSHMCMTPVTIASAGKYCRTNEAFDPTAITDASGNTTGGCAIPCNDDLDCSGTCVANAQAPTGYTGFCATTTQLCNGPTGQCEDTCASASSGATDCIHGTCTAGIGPNGENQCGLACQSASDNCAVGECDTTAKLCVYKPAITTLTLGGMDVLATGKVTVASGPETLAWATAHAGSTTLDSASVPTTGGCAAVTSWTAVASGTFSGNPTGTATLQLTAATCYRFEAVGPASSASQIFEADIK